MTEYSLKCPSNSEVVKDNGLIKEYFRVLTATSVVNGAVVTKDTNDGSIKAAGDADLSAIGVVVRDWTEPNVRESDRSTAYSVGDEVCVVSGAGSIVVVTGSEAIGRGNALACAASGQVRKATTTEDIRKLIGKAKETTTASGVLMMELLI